MTQPQRPLSPHLQVYRPQITMVMSISHRITGVVLSLGALGVAAWLLAVAGDAQTYASISALFASLPGKLLLFAFSAALMYHLLNGIRHLIWDTGRGLEIAQFYRSGHTVLVLTVLATAGLWALAGGAA